MGKRQKDTFPFNYWRAREGNSKCTGVLNVFKVRRQKDICMGKSNWTCVLFGIREQEREIQTAQVNFIKVRRQKKKNKKKVICKSVSSFVAHA